MLLDVVSVVAFLVGITLSFLFRSALKEKGRQGWDHKLNGTLCWFVCTTPVVVLSYEFLRPGQSRFRGWLECGTRTTKGHL